MAKKKKSSSGIIRLILLLIAISAVYFLYKYRREVINILDNKSTSVTHPNNYEVYGIDVSHYQTYVNWDKLGTINDSNKISFAFIRATAGKNLRDKYFTSNWRDSKKNGIIRGAYHYYRPNENSIEQANNFIKNVELESGDLPPVLDIEKLSSIQNINSLRIGLKKWIKKIEEHYKVKPIIYSSSNYFNTYLKNEFDGYIVWVANYNNTKTPILSVNWDFWQYTCYGRLEGIDGYVDLNIYKKDLLSLEELCIK